MRAALLICLLVAAAAFLSPVKAADCARGFKAAADGRCALIDIPENARLNENGNGWQCNWGYRRTGNQCLVVDVPRNATLSSFGDFWMCNHAYYEMHGVCLPDETARAKPAPRVPVIKEVSPQRRAVLRRSPERTAALTRLNILTVVVAGVITWGIFFLLREPPASNTPNYTTKYVPRARGSSTLAIWRPFGHRIDALTGGAIAGSAPVAQCRNCRAWYQAESAATLRRENGARCISCGRVALTQGAA